MSEDGSERGRLPRVEWRSGEMQRRFLEGRLHIGSSLSLTCRGEKILFPLHGKAKRDFDAWWTRENVHEKMRSVNARLVVHSTAVPLDNQLSRDLEYQRAPFTHVQVFLTPAEHLDMDGRKRTSTVLRDHRGRDHAPRFLVQALGRRKGELHLMQFVRDTVEYKAELDRIATVKAANWRPFITPYPVQIALGQEARLELKPYPRWQDQQRDGDVDGPEVIEADAAILAEADRVAAAAAASLYAVHASSVFSDVLHHSSVAICTDDHCRGCCVALVSSDSGPITSTATRHKTDKRE